jgi:hypothetical protein
VLPTYAEGCPLREMPPRFGRPGRGQRGTYIVDCRVYVGSTGLSPRDAFGDRGCLFVAVDVAAHSARLADFDAERVFCLLVGLGLVCGSVVGEAGAAGVAAGATCAFGLRPKPRALAIVDRCSE